MGGHDDPADQAPWAMQLVVRVERHDPPGSLAVCEAAAAAVVVLLADDRAQPGGPWRPAVQRWTSGRIRKIVRRARGSRWRATAALEHVAVQRAGAHVRAFVPCPVDAVPVELSRLQVGDTDVPERGAAARPHAAGVTIAITPEVPMSTGKAAAQCGHAAQLAWAAMDDERRGAWRAAGFPVSVGDPPVREWRLLLGSAPVRVADAGFTEIPPGTVTTVAYWSAEGALLRQPARLRAATSRDGTSRAAGSAERGPG
jgi:peptidyl-tRNA hydrolase